MDVVFESKNILYVRPSFDLIPDYLEMVNDIEHVARFIGERREPYTEEEERSYMQSKMDQHATMFSMLERDTHQFIGNIWQMIVGAVLTVSLFINHFMITRKRSRKLWRIEVNQGIVFFLLLFRTYQVIENIASRGFTPLMIEITVGLLAIVPTLNVIACIESRTESYVPEN